MIINGKHTNINYEDFILDLTTDKTKGDTNLSDDDLVASLIQMDKIGMPVSQIRSKKLQKLYKTLRAEKQQAFQKAKTSGDSLPTTSKGKQPVGRLGRSFKTLFGDDSSD